jgi:toxin ParE1/3/4
LSGQPVPKFASLAEADLEEIAVFIARDSKRQAEIFIAALESAALAAAAMPFAYPARPEYGLNIRMARHGRYVILFRPLKSGTIRVERILHTARDLRRLF